MITVAKQLIHRDEKVISELNRAIIRTKPFLEEILNQWNALPELDNLITESLQGLFDDPESFINETKIMFYQRKYANAHEKIGITPAIGIDLISYPDFSLVLDRLNLLKELQRNRFNEYSDISYFNINENTLVINEDRIAAFVEGNSFYLDTPAQQEYYKLVMQLISAIEKVEKATTENLYFSIFYNRVFGQVEGYNFDEIIQMQNDKTLIPKLEVFRKFKERGI